MGEVLVYLLHRLPVTFLPCLDDVGGDLFHAVAFGVDEFIDVAK